MAAHELTPDDVMAFFDGELTDMRADEVGAHVRTCARCQAIGADAAAVSNAMADWKIEPAPGQVIAPSDGGPDVQTRRVRRPFASPLGKIALLAAAALVVIVAIRGGLTRSHVSPAGGPPAGLAPVETFATAWFQQPRVTLPFDPGDARVLIVAFLDWLCRACRSTSQMYAPVLSRYAVSHPGAVKYIVKDWPWDPACNPHTPFMQNHGASCTAAFAVRLARDRGNADAMIAWLFDHLDELTQMSPNDGMAAIKEAAQRLLGIGDFDTASNDVRAAIQADIEAGIALHVDQTPTYFINGVRIPAARVPGAPPSTSVNLPASSFDAAIAAELARRR